MILKPKSCSFPLQRYGCCKNHFCVHVNGDVNFDKLVHENMFYSVIVGFPKSGHILSLSEDMSSENLRQKTLLLKERGFQSETRSSDSIPHC